MRGSTRYRSLGNPRCKKKEEQGPELPSPTLDSPLGDIFHFFKFNTFFGYTTQHVESQFPQPGIELMPPTVEAQSLVHRWTAREVLGDFSRGFPR